ncbi:MAG: LarC family nickel insertion protein, partial [Acidobacteriota bacterium]
MSTDRAGGRILFIEPCCGISGDMLLGALLDLGADPEHLRRQLGLLPFHGYSLSIRKCLKAGITSTKFDVHLASDHPQQPEDHHHHHHHRTFAQIRTMISESGLSAWVREHAVDAFARLAAAEGKIHDQAPEQVHFHEVGAVDSIIDIVGTMVALEGFLPLSIRCAPVNVGSGTLQCRHGVYPVPGPAALQLLENIPIYSDATGGELTTPTGAALLAALVGEFGPRPPMRVTAAGYGAGTRDIPGVANVLRVSLGEAAADCCLDTGEKVTVIDANIDDMNPQLYDYFMEKALALG